MNPSLQKRALSGVKWSALERIGQQSVGFCVQLILARILAPEEFGLLAMVAVFVAICRGIADAGLHEAVVQSPILKPALVSSVFFANLMLGLILAGLLYLCSPYVADFYDEASLKGLLRVLSIALIVDGFARIQLSLLQRELRFKRLAIASLMGTVVSGVVAVVLAFLGHGVWALVWQIILQRFIVAIHVWFASDWKPSFSFSLTEIRGVMPFALPMFVSNLLNNVFQQIHVIVIGKITNPAQLGYYQRADAFKRMATSTSNTLMARISFPLFAKVQDDIPRLKRGFNRATRLLAFTFFPFMALLVAVAEPLVVTLIGEKWIASVLYLQLLCVGGSFHPIHAVNLSVIKALGKGRLFLKVEILKKLINFITLLITFSYGILAIIYGQVFVSILFLVINAYYNRKLICVTYAEQVCNLSASLFCSVLVGLCGFILVQSIDTNPFIELLVGGGFILILWCGLIYLFRRKFTVEISFFSSYVRNFLPFRI